MSQPNNDANQETNKDPTKKPKKPLGPERKRQIAEFEIDVRDLLAKIPEAKALYAQSVARQAITEFSSSIHLEHVLEEAELIYETGSAGGHTHVRIHPAVETIARAQERVRKAMKDLLAQLEEEGEESGLGIADLLLPTLEKAGDVLKDETQLQSRAKETQTKKSQQPRDRTNTDPPLQDRRCTGAIQGSPQPPVGSPRLPAWLTRVHRPQKSSLRRSRRRQNLRDRDPSPLGHDRSPPFRDAHRHPM